VKTFFALLAFATLARADDAQTAIKAIETENHVKFVGEAPINGSNRTQWIFAAPETANGIRIRIHVISHPSRLDPGAFPHGEQSDSRRKGRLTPDFLRTP